MIQLDLIDDLAGSRICQIRQDVATLIIDFRETAAGTIRVSGEATAFGSQIAGVVHLNRLPSWHPARVVAWADIMADCLIIAMEYGDRFSLRAQSLRIERGVELYEPL